MSKAWKKGQKLCEEQVREIKDLRRQLGARRRVPRSHPLSLESLSRRFGVATCTISMIVTGRDWKHVQ